MYHPSHREYPPRDSIAGALKLHPFCWNPMIWNGQQTCFCFVYHCFVGYIILIPTCISNYIHHIVWDEITYPFPNFSSATVEVWEWISNFIPHFTGCVITYPCWDFTNRSWAHDPNLVKKYIALTWKIIIRSDQNFVHAITADQSWNVQNWDLIGWLESKLEQKEVTRFKPWAHKLFVKLTLRFELRSSANLVTCG